MGHCLTINNVIFMQTDFKYADLLNDEVFKLVFGQESSKDVMIEFLDQVISDRTMDEETRLKILDSMTTERDLKNQLAYARKEGFAVGREEGREEERRANAAKLKTLGVDVAIISQATGLSVEDINLL